MKTDRPFGVPRVSAAILYDAAQQLEQRQIDPQILFDKAGISLAATKDPYQMVSLPKYTRLLELAARATELPALGLELGARQDPSKWGAFGYVILNSPSVGAALKNIATFLKTTQHGTRIVYVRQRHVFGIEYSILHPSVTHKSQDAEFSMAFVKNVVDRLCEWRVSPEVVHFEHAPLSEMAVYEKALGVVPYFDQPANKILFPKTVEDRTVRSADLHLFPIIRQHLVDMAKSVPDDFDLVATVSYHIRQALPGGQCTLEDMATVLAVGVRTLQRRLMERGTSFTQLLDQIRRELAFHHVETTTMEIKEISFLLGFTDTSAFIKSFKKWSGQTPGKYRLDLPEY